MANIVMVVVLLQPTVLMAKKTAYNDDKRPSIDHYGCPGTQKRGEIC